ncbi:MAG: helix-turn-helix domain-containing protein [Rhizobiaceae bacterium]
MTLAEYLNSQKMTEAAFADRLNVSQVTVHRYVKGQRFPDRDMILRISELTGARVAPADWFAAAPKPERAA